jgi:uncharacterized membrane protein YqaE (UPF0057 family)
MKKIFTLISLFTGVAFLTSTVFAASVLLTPEKVSPAESGPTANTKGITIDESLPPPDALTIHNAMDDFKHLSKADKKERFKEAKAALKQYKKDKRSGQASEGGTEMNLFLLILITILLPPLGVYLHEGQINTKFWISIILTLLFYFPGLIYGLIVVLS